MSPGGARLPLIEPGQKKASGLTVHAQSCMYKRRYGLAACLVLAHPRDHLSSAASIAFIRRPPVHLPTPSASPPHSITRHSPGHALRPRSRPPPRPYAPVPRDVSRYCREDLCQCRASLSCCHSTADHPTNYPTRPAQLSTPTRATAIAASLPSHGRRPPCHPFHPDDHRRPCHPTQHPRLHASRDHTRIHERTVVGACRAQ